MTSTNPVKRAHPFSIPNLLTYSRIAAVPVVVTCVIIDDIWVRWVAVGFYVAAAVSDFFDGYLARVWSQQSALGRMLDPIADKLLVATCLLALTAEGTLTGWAFWAGLVILSREILVSGLREFLAELQVSVPVTQLAKWKTAVQMIAIGVLLAGPAGDRIIPFVTETGLIMLGLAATLTLYTGWDYFRAGMRHILDEG